MVLQQCTMVREKESIIRELSAQQRVLEKMLLEVLLKKERFSKDNPC